MTLDLQFKIKENPHYQKYIRENSNWYKLLNRDPLMFKNFETEVKETYKLRPSDKITKLTQTFELLGTIVSSFNK